MMMSVLLAFSLAAEPASPPLAPIGPWIVRAEENLCLLERRYTSEGRPISLVFQPLLDLQDMEVFVVTAGESGSQQQGSFSAGIAPAEKAFTGRYLSVVSTKAKARITRLTADRHMLDDLKDGDALRIQAKPVDQTFAITRPEKARVALQSCVDVLKKEWGIDPEASARIVTPLSGNPARFFGDDSFPPEAIAQGVYGRVIALLNIDSSGAVERCRVVSSAGKLLNEGTCKAAKRIRFKPALDKDGKPLPSTFVLPVRWVLPGASD
jgi:TonB family protein